MWFKKIKKKKVQSAIILLLVMLCSMLMVSAVTIMTSLNSPYKELVKETDAEDARIYLRSGDYDLALKMQSKLMQQDVSRNVEIRTYVYSGEEVIAAGKKVGGFFDVVLAEDYSSSAMRKISGKFDDISSNECLIPAVVANTNHLKLGDPIKAAGREYIIAGIYTNVYNMNLSYDAEIIVQEFPQDAQIRYYLSIFAKDKYDGYDMTDAYREDNEGILEGFVVYLDARISNNQLTEMIFGAVLLIMSIIVLLVCGLMISYLIKHTVATERDNIATYKTIGMTGKQIIRLYMGMYIVIVAIGSILGVFFSGTISDSFTKATYKNLGVTSSQSALLAGVISSVVIIGYVTLILYIELRKIEKIRPIEVFRNVIQTKVKKKKHRSENGFSPLAMAYRMIRHEKKNTVIVIITCIVTAYCINFAATAIDMINGMADNNYYWIGFDKHDVTLEALGSVDIKPIVEEMREYPETDRAIMSTTSVNVSLPWKKGIGDTSISSMVYETYENLDISCTDGRNPIYADEVAIGNAIADRLGKTIGDYIEIYIGGYVKKTLLISGTFQGYYNMGNSCRLLTETVEEAGIPVEYEYASIFLKHGVTVSEYVKKYKDINPDIVRIYDRRDKYTNIMKMVNGPQMMALKPFIGLVMVIGTLNIIAIIWLKNQKNRKTLCIYKAIGFSTGHLMKTNIWYVTMIAGISIIITIPSFIIIFPQTMILSMSLFGFREYPVSYKVFTIIWANASIFALFILSSIISSLGLYRQSVKELTID